MSVEQDARDAVDRALKEHTIKCHSLREPKEWTGECWRAIAEASYIRGVEAARKDRDGKDD